MTLLAAILIFLAVATVLTAIDWYLSDHENREWEYRR